MDGDAGLERWVIKGPGNTERWKSRICPRKLITAETRAWLQLFSTYKAGFLLEGGGILDQPAIYINVMTIIESLISETREK